MADYMYIPPEGAYSGDLGIVPTVVSEGGVTVPMFVTAQTQPQLPKGHYMSPGDYYGYQATHPTTGENMVFPTDAPAPPVIMHPKDPYSQITYIRRPVISDPRVANYDGRGGRYVSFSGAQSPGMQMHGYTVESLNGYPSKVPHVLDASPRDYAAPWQLGALMYDPNLGQRVAAYMLPAMMNMMGRGGQPQGRGGNASASANVRVSGSSKGTASTPKPTTPPTVQDPRVYEGLDYTQYRECVARGECLPDSTYLGNDWMPTYGEVNTPTMFSGTAQAEPSTQADTYVPVAAGGGVMQDQRSFVSPKDLPTASNTGSTLLNTAVSATTPRPLGYAPVTAADPILDGIRMLRNLMGGGY